MTVLLECRDLVKRYGRIRAIDGLSFTIEAGAPVGLVGPNGAGKTTLFSLIAGFIRPGQGSIHIHGTNTPRSGQIGILPQDAPFLKGIRVRDQLRLFARLQGMNAAAALEESRRMAGDFEVADLLGRYPEKLSYGQRKRVALAQALLVQPDLVLLDEPTSGLDPVAADDVRRLIRMRARDVTFMISSHNLAEIEDICETIIVINEGRLVVTSSVAELRGQDQHMTLELETEATDAVLATMNGTAGIVRAHFVDDDRGRIGVEYDGQDPSRLQMELLQLLSEAGIAVVRFSRGKKLSEGIVRLVRGDV